MGSTTHARDPTDFVFHDLDGNVMLRICMQHGDSYQLAGPVNIRTKHSVPACADCGLCVTFSWRCVRNSVSPDGKFATVNGKRVPLDYLERELEKKSKQELQTECAEFGVDGIGSKAELARRLATLPPDELRTLQIKVLASGHTPEMPVATRALRVQGPELAELMLNGGKVLENRRQLGLGWWVVYVGKDPNWRTAKWAEPFKEVLDTVPVDET